MSSEQKICAKKILDRLVSFLLTVIGICAILVICICFILPYSQEINYIQTCMEEGHDKNWCQQVWEELEELD